MKRNEIVKQMGFTKELNTSVIATEIRSLGTKISETVSNQIDSYTTQLITDDTVIALYPYRLTKQMKTQIEKVTGKEVQQLSKLIDKAGFWDKWCEADDIDETQKLTLL